MKKTCFILILGLIYCYGVQAQNGMMVVDTIHSKHLENEFGEPESRPVSVYLPPGYTENKQQYPVIYFLHGFNGDHKMDFMVDVLDYAINQKRIRPFIMVFPNHKTAYGGSFYTNSALYGNFEDFTAYDVVAHIDTKYRTIPAKESRGITGHSMGGYGAIQLAVHHPDLFSTIYAISPGALAIVREYGPNSNTYKEVSASKTVEELQATYFGGVMLAFGRSWSPNKDKAPFYCDFPFSYENNELTVHQEVLKKWQSAMPYYTVEKDLENYQKLKAIKLDWGRNAGDRFTIQCSMYSQRLENAGITHFAEEYIGTHVSDIYTKKGRIPQQVLPFFDEYLNF